MCAIRPLQSKLPMLPMLPTPAGPVRLTALLILAMALPLLSGCGKEGTKKIKKETPNQVMSMVSINLEAADTGCAGLCDSAAEGTLKSRLEQINPDLILLQRVVSLEQCQQLGAAAPASCAGEGEQIDRLLPNGYLARCGAAGALCVAVNPESGAELPAGESLPGFTAPMTGCARTVALPNPHQEEVPATAAQVNVVWQNGALFRAVVVDLPAAAAMSFCRYQAIYGLFGGDGVVSPLAGVAVPSLVAGTFGFDPYAVEPYLSDLTETVAWHTWVGSATDAAYQYLSGARAAGLTRPPVTDRLLDPELARIDHVLGHKVPGNCMLLDGKTEGVLAPMGGNVPLATGSRHFGFYCELDLTELAVE